MEPDLTISEDTATYRVRAAGGSDARDRGGRPPIDAHRPPPGHEDEDEDEKPIGDPDDDDWQGEDWDEDDDEPLRAVAPGQGVPANRR